MSRHERVDSPKEKFVDATRVWTMNMNECVRGTKNQTP